jgi:hypothetical protein
MLRRHHIKSLVVKWEARTKAHRWLAAMIDGPRGRIQPFIQRAKTRHRTADSGVQRVAMVNALHAIAIAGIRTDAPRPGRPQANQNRGHA